PHHPLLLRSGGDRPRPLLRLRNDRRRRGGARAPLHRHRSRGGIRRPLTPPHPRRARRASLAGRGLDPPQAPVPGAHPGAHPPRTSPAHIPRARPRASPLEALISQGTSAAAPPPGRGRIRVPEARRVGMLPGEFNTREDVVATRIYTRTGVRYAIGTR